MAISLLKLPGFARFLFLDFTSTMSRFIDRAKAFRRYHISGNNGITFEMKLTSLSAFHIRYEVRESCVIAH